MPPHRPPSSHPRSEAYALSLPLPSLPGRIRTAPPSSSSAGHGGGLPASPPSSPRRRPPPRCSLAPTPASPLRCHLPADGLLRGPHPGQARQRAERSGGSCPFAASPRPNRSRERESREHVKRLRGGAVLLVRLAQFHSKQLAKLPVKLCQRHPKWTQLHGVDDNIGKSKKILAAMSKRMDRNKWIIGGIITALVLAILLIIYIKLAH